MVQRKRILCGALVVLTLTGCGRPHVSPGPDVELPDAYIYSIVLQNSDVLVFDWFGYGHWSAVTSKNAHVEGNNVVGYVDGQRTEIRLADIQDIQYRGREYVLPLVFTVVLLASATALSAWLFSGWSLD